MNYELIDAMATSKLIIFKWPFIFIWYGGHTVNIWDAYSEKEISILSIGNYANDKITIKDFINGVKRYSNDTE